MPVPLELNTNTLELCLIYETTYHLIPEGWPYYRYIKQTKSIKNRLTERLTATTDTLHALRGTLNGSSDTLTSTKDT